MASKVYLNRLRRMAARQGYAIRKSRTRDPRALTYGVLTVLSPRGRAVVTAAEIKSIEAFLNGSAQRHG